MPKPSERRRAARFPAVANRLRVEWSDGAGGTPLTVAGTLLNISRGGALLQVEPPPPVQKPIWIRFEEPAATDWVGASVLRHDGKDRAALVFSDACPYDFYQAAILGIRLDNML